MYRAIDEVFEAFRERVKAPACGYALIESGTVVHSWAGGIADLELARAASPDNVFRIASMSKSFAAAAILLLRDLGKLSLEESVTAYIPELQNREAWRRVSLLHLLSMQSGLPTDDPWADRTLKLTDEEYSRVISGPVNFICSPGTEFHYSNFNYFLLGRVISLISGVHALEFIRRYFFEPLALSDTGWRYDPGKIDRIVHGYAMHAERYVKETNPFGGGFGAVFAGIWSTLEDIARWIRFLNAGAGESAANAVLGHESRQQLQRAVILGPFTAAASGASDPSAAATAYGLGLKLWAAGGFWTVGHSGGFPGYSSHMRWSRDHGVAIAAFTNLTYAPVWDVCRDALDFVLHEKRKLELPVPEILLRRFRELGGLIARYDESLAASLFSENVFLDRPPEELRRIFVELQTAAAGAPFHLAFRGGLRADLLLEGIPRLRFSLSPAADSPIQEIHLLSQ